MLTVKQLLAIESGRFTSPLSSQVLFQKFPAKSLSLRNIINAVEQQNFAYFVELRNIALLQQSSSFDDLQTRWKMGEGKLQGSDILTFINNVLVPRGVVLKLVTSDSRGLIAGSVAALITVPTVPISPVNLEDVATGLGNIASGAEGLGALLMGIGSFPEPASIPLLAVGSGLVGLGVGIQLTLGIIQVVDSNQSTTNPTTNAGTSSSDQTEVPQPDGDSVSIPNAEVYGDLPDGVNVPQLAESVAIDIFAIDAGLDANTGSGLPNIPGVDLGDGNGGDTGGDTGGGLGGGYFGF